MTSIQCHYEVLSVARDADQATIKKCHRKLALKYHPDKNNGETTEQFRLIQEAYECLSDPAERKWYDEHREAILQGWTAGGGSDGAAVDILFDIVHFLHPSCYDGYEDDEGGFYAVYRMVFREIYQGEERLWTNDGNVEAMPSLGMPVDFGTSETEWKDVSEFYRAWESFVSCASFAWADVYDVKEAPNRRVRRAMEDENKKARKAAKRTRNEDVLALVHFVKRRDPRVKRHYERIAQEKAQRKQQEQETAKKKKQETKQAREAWKEQAQRAMEEAEEEDRLAGRIRLADLEDDYEYVGQRGKKGRKNKKNKKRQQQQVEEEDQETNSQGENDSGEHQVEDEDGFEEGTEKLSAVGQDAAADEETGSEMSSEPDVWRCECCRKDFKSDGQMQNHMKSKKHKEAWKKYQAKLKEEDIMNEMLGVR